MSIQNDADNQINNSLEGHEMDNIEQSADPKNLQPDDESHTDDSIQSKEQQLESEIEQLIELEKRIFGQNGGAILAVHKENLRLEQNLYEYRSHLRRSTVIAILSVLANVVLLIAFLPYQSPISLYLFSKYNACVIIPFPAN